MNRNPYAYAYWAVVVSIIYSVAGISTEHEFLPNPVWLITGKPAPGFCSQCGTDFVLIIAILIAIPAVFWLRSKSTGERALVSKKNLAIILGTIVVIASVVGFFILQKVEEDREARIQYDTNVSNNAIVREVLTTKNSPMKPYFMDFTVEDGTGTVYFTDAAAPLLDTGSERNTYLKPLEIGVLSVPGVNAVRWSVGSEIFYSNEPVPGQPSIPTSDTKSTPEINVKAQPVPSAQGGAVPTESRNSSAEKIFSVKKVPVGFSIDMSNEAKTMEISYTTQALSYDPKKLQICWTLLDVNNVRQTETDCWALNSYGVFSVMTNADFSLAPTEGSTIYQVGHNTVKILFELVDPLKYEYDEVSKRIKFIPLASDDTGFFDLYIPAAQ